MLREKHRVGRVELAVVLGLTVQIGGSSSVFALAGVREELCLGSRPQAVSLGGIRAVHPTQLPGLL